MPIDAREIAVIVEIYVESAVIGAFHGLAEAPGQMNVGGADHKTVFCVLDRDHPIQRMLGVFGRLHVPDEADDLIFQMPRQAVQGHDPAG
ncbi:MAG TPA: hypothetical protein VME45_22965 [Stellaceae bacterium]|nr:hypothetical protein [Stellaceae bacterium]